MFISVGAVLRHRPLSLPPAKNNNKKNLTGRQADTKADRKAEKSWNRRAHKTPIDWKARRQDKRRQWTTKMIPAGV